MYAELIDKVMKMLLTTELEVLVNLKAQYDNSVTTEITETGKGFFASFRVTNPLLKITDKKVKSDFVFGDVNGIINGIVGAVGFILFIEDGMISTLEGYSNVPGSWDDVTKDMQLVYLYENRHLENLEYTWTKGE